MTCVLDLGIWFARVPLGPPGPNEDSHPEPQPTSNACLRVCPGDSPANRKSTYYSECTTWLFNITSRRGDRSWTKRGGRSWGNEWPTRSSPRDLLGWLTPRTRTYKSLSRLGGRGIIWLRMRGAMVLCTLQQEAVIVKTWLQRWLPSITKTRRLQERRRRRRRRQRGPRNHPCVPPEDQRPLLLPLSPDEDGWPN